MCGIAGRYNFRSGAPVGEDVLAAMCRLVAHRGPDGKGTWAADAVGFGHRRLSIIDLSDAGRQPMQTADGQTTITFNGEIYNFEEIRRDLESRGCAFASRTDTEVILQAYRVFGPACVRRLRGMFAFAIWDAGARRLFAARDRLGKKPFYYREDADGLAFASEPKAFLAEASFAPEADRRALFDYLSFQYVPGAASAFRGVRRLLPGHTLTLEDGRVTLERYWSLEFLPKARGSEADAEEDVLERLRAATRLRMISDVPLGAFLSGGVDSSLVVALMAEAGLGRVKTFSIGFDEAVYNELPHAKAVAERFGTEHHEAVVRPDAVALLPKMVWHYNEPYADSSAIPTFYLAEMTRRHVTVALNGDGGDEGFGGYERYPASLAAARIDHIPRPLRRLVARAAAVLPAGETRSTRTRLARFLAAAADGRERRYARWMFHFDADRKRDLCTPAFLADVTGADSGAYLERLFADARGEGFLDALLSVDTRSYLPDDLLVKVDIATMAFGLEGRSPLLDHEVMEAAAHLPERLKVRGLQKKRLLRRIAGRFLPASILDRPKMGFGVPLDRWFRQELRELTHDVLLDGRLAARGYFHQRYVEHLVREHETGVRSCHYQLWNLLMFELWHRTFIDARGGSVAGGAS
jgi:asparagine synthase (glutamine-hydrolysing)